MAVTVIGSSLAALVATLRISEFDDVLWVQTSPRIGGHFSGIEIDGVIRDIGMVLLEPFENFDEIEPDFHKFKKASRQGARGLIPYAFDWLGSLGFSIKNAQVFTKVDGQTFADFYIKDSLEIIHNLPNDVKSDIAREIKSLSNYSFKDLHPSNKLTSPDFLIKSFEEITLMTIGPTYMREVIKPWANSFAKRSAVSVVAAEHRAMWLPMYYPESILRAVSGESSDFDGNEKTFAVPIGISVGAAINDLVSLVKTKKNVCVELAETHNFGEDVNQKVFLGNIDEFKLIFHEDRTMESELKTNSDTKANIAVAIFEGIDVMSDFDDCTVNVQSHPSSLYRISIRQIFKPTNHLQFTLEFGDAEGLSEIEIKTMSATEIGKFYSGSSKFKKIIRTKFPITSAKTLADHSKRIAAYESELCDNGIIGFLISQQNSAFNDQLCQGLLSAEQTRKRRSNA